MKFDIEKLSYRPTTGVDRVHDLPLVVASDESLRGYGYLVETPDERPIEIVRWPATGTRPIDPNTGDEGGTTEGVFEFDWNGDVLFACNNAVNDQYLFGWSTYPEKAQTGRASVPRERALIWRANYHPDGGQLFFPTQGHSFVVPLALPGDDVTPEKFVAFWCDGKRGLYIHPNVWHGAVVPHDDRAELFDRQGKVHARVSVDFPKEFGCYIGVPLRHPASEG
jgi:ureidoglycolate lyase